MGRVEDVVNVAEIKPEGLSGELQGVRGQDIVWDDSAVGWHGGWWGGRGWELVATGEGASFGGKMMSYEGSMYLYGVRVEVPNN